MEKRKELNTRMMDGKTFDFGEHLEHIIESAKEIVGELKDRELTYEEAYGALQLACDIIHFESKFVHLPKY